MVLRGYELKDILKLKHIPKVRTRFTYYKSRSVVIITPVNPVGMVSSFSYFEVELIEDVIISKPANCA